MKLVAKDFINKTSILDAMMNVCNQFAETSIITMVGIPDVSVNTNLKMLKFRLLPKHLLLDTEQLPYNEIERTYCWTHVEATISNINDNESLPWISEDSLKRVMSTWTRLDEMLEKNETDFEDYFYKSNTEKKSSYTLTRDELMLLLSLQGGQTLRQVVLGKQNNPADLLSMLFSSMTHKLLTKISYDPNTDYALSIKAIGDRINILAKNATLADSSTRIQLSDLLMHDLVLLTVKYPDTECISVSGFTIDVSETVNALNLTKDIQYACSIGSSILKPLNIIYASVASSLVWTLGFEQTVELLARTDKEIIEKYKGVKSDRKTHLIRSL